MEKKITENKYNEYYFALKKVYELHLENGFGKSPDIPSGFSESLCRYLINASEGTDRTHDAISEDGKSIEIKSTGTNEGKTTISNSNYFDMLVWVFIEFEKDKVHIYEMPKSVFSLSGGAGRKSISLGSIAKNNNINPTVYSFQRLAHHS